MTTVDKMIMEFLNDDNEKMLKQEQFIVAVSSFPPDDILVVFVVASPYHECGLLL